MPLEPRGPRKTDDFAARHLGKTEDPDLSILSGPQIAQAPAFLPWPALPPKRFFRDTGVVPKIGTEKTYYVPIVYPGLVSGQKGTSWIPPSLKGSC